MRPFIRSGLVCLALAAIVAATVTPAWAASVTASGSVSQRGPGSRSAIGAASNARPSDAPRCRCVTLVSDGMNWKPS